MMLYLLCIYGGRIMKHVRILLGLLGLLAVMSITPEIYAAKTQAQAPLPPQTAQTKIVAISKDTRVVDPKICPIPSKDAACLLRQSEAFMLINNQKQQDCGCITVTTAPEYMYYIKTRYKTKAACEKKAPKDFVFGLAADHAFNACRADYSCPKDCPNQRLGMPERDDICACENNKTRKFLPKGWWTYGCEINNKFNCCCMLEI
jgi:hypothetical protein